MPTISWSWDGATWTAVPDPGGLLYGYGPTALVYSNRIWIMGGRGYNGFQNDVWYSTNGLKWTSATLHAAWRPRCYHASVVHDGKMWVMGGEYTGTGGTYQSLNDVWYSTNGVKWTSATLSAGWRPRSRHGAAAFRGKIWIFDGDIWNSTNGSSWSLVMSPAPWTAGLGRDQIKATVCDDRLWVMGGQNFLWGTAESDVWCSSDGYNWTRVTPYAPWPGRIGFGLVVHDRKMWVLGGYAPGYRGSQGRLLNDVWYSSMPAAVTPAWKLYP